MHSFWYRANAVLTFGVTMLAVMCTLASLSDNFNLPSPSAEVKILNINWFQKQANGNDEVSMTLNVSSDLSSLFTWNTKQVFVFVAAEYETPQNALNQVSLWDGIIPSKEHSKFWIHTTNKYRFVDQDVANTNHYWFVPPIRTKYFGQGLVWSVVGQSRICHCLSEGSNLKGKDFNLTLHWHIMPKTGKMFADKIVMTGYRLPEEYR